MKPNNTFLFLALTLIFSSTICIRKGICKFCGTQCTALELHEYHCGKIPHKHRASKRTKKLCEFCKGDFCNLKSHVEVCPFNPKGLGKKPCPYCGKKIKYLIQHLNWCPGETVYQSSEWLVEKYRINKKKKRKTRRNLSNEELAANVMVLFSKKPWKYCIPIRRPTKILIP